MCFHVSVADDGELWGRDGDTWRMAGCRVRGQRAALRYPELLPSARVPGFFVNDFSETESH